MSSTPIFSFGLPPPEAGLQALTIEYLEHMRCFCRQNDYDIQKLFEEFDPLGTGDVPDFTFLHIIHEKFWSQVGFSMEQVRVIADLFRNPLGEISYMRLHDWMKSDDNIVDQMIQLHCTCASLYPALVCSLLSSVCRSDLFSRNAFQPTPAGFTSTTCFDSMLSLSPPPTPTHLPVFGIQHQIPTQRSCTTGGGDLETPVRFTLGHTEKPHVRKPRRYRSGIVGNTPSAYTFRPFSPLNTSFMGETSAPPFSTSSIFGIPEVSEGERVSQSSPVHVTAAASFQTLFRTFGTSSDTSVSWFGAEDRGHLAPQNPKHLIRNYAF